MTHVYNTERGFKDEYLEGLVAAYGRYLRRVPGASGVMSVTAPETARPSVIIGGGSGHYPAFAGLVGPGLCDGAIVGDIFTSPSSEQAYRCIKALDGGAGVLVSFGNYSGDVMNFGLAAQRARAEGTDVRIVLVTDDVASKPADQRLERRGIAGGFFVYRAAAAAAHAGRTIDEVERVARDVNDAVFTFGVAFDGCTFPGRAEPLFHVERGRMDLGLGIHGEPGIETIDWIPAEQLARVLVQPLLDERPPGASRARVLLNGLGATKYEELFVLYRSVAGLLAGAGVEIVEPEVGEFVTSLDMAGCSLTVCWLEPAWQDLLDAPALAPGYRAPGSEGNGHRVTTASLASRSSAVGFAPPATVPAVSPSVARPETALARGLVRMFRAMAVEVSSAEAELGRLDAAAGDGDHGAGMARGTLAAADAAEASGPRGQDVLRAAGLAFSDAAGGASGALWGAGLLGAAEELASLDDGARAGAEEAPDSRVAHRLASAALRAIVALGGSSPGDKTLVDALAPFVETLGASVDRPLAEAWVVAARAATDAATATADLPSRKGRAAVHGERSRGTPDPGAVSMALALTAAGGTLANEPRETAGAR